MSFLFYAKRQNAEAKLIPKLDCTKVSLQGIYFLNTLWWARHRPPE